MKTYLFNLLKFMSVLIIVLTLLISTYVYYDPFKVVRKYDSYYVSGQPSFITLNRDYVSVETFLNNYPDYHYDSFIFGNSRTRFYRMETWSKLIHSDKCFHFDASSESLYGIFKKIEFLDKNSVGISNALIVLDHGTLKETANSNGHLFIKHPLLSGQNSISFQVEFFKAFCSYEFLPAYLDYKISDRVKPYMIRGHLLDDIIVDYNLKYNEISFNKIEEQINKDPQNYYADKMKRFYSRSLNENSSDPVIKENQEKMLEKIMEVLKRKGTNYKIIISPLYDQLKLNKTDLTKLYDIFGAENVFDFSGINTYTSDYHNYYEESHYRPRVSDGIMKSIYID